MSDILWPVYIPLYSLISAIAMLTLAKNINLKPVYVVSLTLTRCFLGFSLVRDSAGLADTGQTNFKEEYLLKQLTTIKTN